MMNRFQTAFKTPSNSFQTLLSMGSTCAPPFWRTLYFASGGDADMIRGLQVGPDDIIPFMSSRHLPPAFYIKILSFLESYMPSYDVL